MAWPGQAGRGMAWQGNNHVRGVAGLRLGMARPGVAWRGRAVAGQR